MPDANPPPVDPPVAGTIGAAAIATPDTAAVKAAADLQAELDQVKARALELEITVLKRDNPDLPDAAFTGDDLAATQAAVAAARATADHVRQQIEDAKNGAAANPAAATAAVAAATGAGVIRQPVTPPEGTRGLARILYGIENQGAK